MLTFSITSSKASIAMKVASQSTITTAACAIHLVTEIVSRVSDTEFTDQLQGSVVTRQVLDQMIAASILRRLSPNCPVVTQP